MTTPTEQRQPSADFHADTVWAMLRGVLDAVVHGRAPKLEPGAAAEDSGFQAFVSHRELTHIDGTYRAAERDGVGILPVFGPVWGRFQWLAYTNDLRTLAADPGIHSIVLAVDSPGGIVTGTQEFAAFVDEVAQEKRVVAHVSGLAASAAYWVASPAAEIVTSMTGELGGLGVMALYTDWSGFDERVGIRDIKIISSQTPDKNRPPTEDRGLALIQARLDDLAQVFLSEVARNRGVSLEVVLRDYGAGDLLVGQRAVDAGLADRLGSFEDVLSGLASSQRTTGGFRMSRNDSQQQPQALAPGLYRIGEDGNATAVNIDQNFLESNDTHKAMVASAVEAAVAESTKQERARVGAIYELGAEGLEEIIKAGVDDGSSAEAVAMRVLQKQREAGTSVADQRADASPTVPAGGTGDAPASGTPAGAQHRWGGTVARLAGKKAAQ